MSKTRKNNTPTIPSYIVFIFVCLLLVIDFLPKRYSGEIATIQYLYLSVFNICLGIYFYANKQLISNDIIPILKRSYVSKFYVIFLIVCGLSAITAKNGSLVLLRMTQLMTIFALFINLAILFRGKLDLFYKGIFLFSIGAFLQTSQSLYQFSGQSSYISTLFALSHLTGNTENVNIFAASLSIKIPFLLMGISHFKGFKKFFLLFTLFLAMTCIFLTGARAAFVNVALIFSVYILYYLKTNSFNKSSLSKISVLIIPILLAILVSTIVFQKTEGNSRYTSIISRIEQINTDDSSAHARLVYWGNAIKIGLANPLLGVGLGNYCIESLPYESSFENGFNASLYPHNDFLQVFAETGIFNILLYLSIFVTVLLINIKKILKFNNDTSEKVAILVIILLISYSVDAFFNFPMYMPSMQMFFCLLMVLTIINTNNLGEEKNYKPFLSKALIFFIGFLTITCYSSIIIYKAKVLQDEIVKDDINSNQKGKLSGDEVIARMPTFPNAFSTSEAFYEYAAIYYLREKNYKKAILYFDKASKINPYLGRIDFYRYFIDKQKGNLDSAYIHIKKGYYLRPRNLTLFKVALSMAGIKKDTAEILKAHETLWKQRKIPEAWNIPAVELHRSNFSKKKLDNFIDQGLKEIPNDSILLKLKNYISENNYSALPQPKKEISNRDYVREGQLFLTESKFDKAKESFKNALKNNPKDSRALQNLGFAYFYQKNYKQARIYFLKSLKDSSLNDGLTEYYLAFCYLRINDKTNACKYFKISAGKKFSLAQKMIDDICK